MPEAIIQSSILSRIPGLQHGFTTRSTPDSLNAKLEGLVSTGKQVHQAGFLWPTLHERRSHEADGVGTLRSNFYVGVYSADCTPLLLALTDQDHAIAVMAVHAGWRGTALRIAEKAVAALVAKAKVESAKQLKLYVAIGPCISFDNFEVGEDVIEAFPGSMSLGLAKKLKLENGRQKYLFNLPGENLRQLRLSAQQLNISVETESLALCTVADPSTFPSFRRDRESAGRILSYIAFGTDHPIRA